MIYMRARDFPRRRVKELTADVFSRRETTFHWHEEGSLRAARESSLTNSDRDEFVRASAWRKRRDAHTLHPRDRAQVSYGIILARTIRFNDPLSYTNRREKVFQLPLSGWRA